MTEDFDYPALSVKRHRVRLMSSVRLPHDVVLNSPDTLYAVVWNESFFAPTRAVLYRDIILTGDETNDRAAVQKALYAVAEDFETRRRVAASRTAILRSAPATQ